MTKKQSKSKLILVVLIIALLGLAIGYAAFDRSENLTTVVFPASLNYIGYGAFGTSKNAGGLTSATFTETTGWWYSSNASDTSGTALDVTNASTNATNLHVDLKERYWHRTVS